MRPMTVQTRRLTLIGWLSFLISGLFYLTAGIRDGDWLVTIGSIVWLVGVAAFVVGLSLDQ